MAPAARDFFVVGLVVFSTACGGSAPTSPTGTGTIGPPSVYSPTPPPPTRSFPPLSGPSRTFTFDRALEHTVSPYTTQSRFVLYDNGAFVLEYSGLGAYRGAYRETSGSIVFEWEGWSAAGPWGASAHLSGDYLTVRYNLVMQLTDFEDAVYKLAP